MPNSKDEQKENKPADEGMEDGTDTLGPKGEEAPSTPPKTPMTERIPKKDVADKKKLTAAERKKFG